MYLKEYMEIVINFIKWKSNNLVEIILDLDFR